MATNNKLPQWEPFEDFLTVHEYVDILCTTISDGVVQGIATEFATEIAKGGIVFLFHPFFESAQDVRNLGESVFVNGADDLYTIGSGQDGFDDLFCLENPGVATDAAFDVTIKQTGITQRKAVVFGVIAEVKGSVVFLFSEVDFRLE